MQKNWKPNKWVAATLSFFFPSLGMLYVARVRLAVMYFFILVGIGLTQFWFVARGYEIPAYLYLVLYIVVVTHTYRIAARAPEIDSRPWYSHWYGLLAAMLIMAVSITLFRAFLFEPFRLPSQSMFPSIPKGSYVVVKKLGYGNYASYGIRIARTEVVAPLIRGDVLVFEFPLDRSINFVKRLIGLPGDHIEYRDKHLFVNGKPLLVSPIGSQGQLEIAQEESYLIANEDGVSSTDLDVKVEPGHLFLVGDNRDNSSDSRQWGQVPYDHVVGRVVLILKNKDAQSIFPAYRPQAGTR